MIHELVEDILCCQNTGFTGKNGGHRRDLGEIVSQQNFEGPKKQEKAS